MSTVIRNIDVRIGEDLREPCEPASTLDVSGWDATWVVKGYWYTDGVLVATIDASGSADGQIIRASSGEFTAHWKRAFLDELVTTGVYFRQYRRTDSGNNYVLVEGTVKMKPYQSV